MGPDILRVRVFLLRYASKPAGLDAQVLARTADSSLQFWFIPPVLLRWYWISFVFTADAPQPTTEGAMVRTRALLLYSHVRQLGPLIPQMGEGVLNPCGARFDTTGN